MGRVDWNDARQEQLRKLRGQGKSFDEIAEAMGLTKGQVAGRCHRTLPKGRALSESTKQLQALKQQARALHKQKLTRAEIAAKLGVDAKRATELLRGVNEGQVGRKAMGPRPAAAEPAPMQDSAPVALPVQFQPAAARCCKWPLWGDRERPTHRYCGRPTTTRRDGVPDVYCAAHRDKATAKTRMWGVAA